MENSNSKATVGQAKKDIVHQIKDLYMRKSNKSKDRPVPLIPTKAALFGLDCRFRTI